MFIKKLIMIPVAPNFTPGHPPSLIAATEKVRDVKISPNGKYIVYQVQPFYKSSDKSVSRLWLAETDAPNSAKPVTDGLFNDRAAVFHPDGERIYFLSNRHNGKGAHIFSLEVVGNDGGGHLTDVTAKLDQKSAQAFDISPNGAFVAFTCVDDGQQLRTTEAKLYHEKTGLSKLKICDIQSGDIWTMNGIRKDKHVESFTWISNSKELIYRLRDNKGAEYVEGNIIVERVPIDGSEEPRIIGSYERSPSSPTMWLPSGHIVELQSFEPRNTLDARTLFIHDPDHDPTHDRHSRLVPRRVYGEKDDAVRMVNARPVADDSEVGEVALEVSVGVDTNIDIARFGSGQSNTPEIFTLFKTNADAIWFGAWDARRVTDDDGNSSYVAAVVLSSGERHQPPNVWAGRSQFGNTIHEMTQLSSHLQWLKEAPMIRTERIVWKADDGMELDGMVRYPPGNEKSSGPLPTVLFVHGGPYR